MRWIGVGAAVFTVAITTSAWAQTCPSPPDHATALQDLIDQAQATTSEAQGQALGQEMWTLWADAPDERAQDMLDRGMSARASYDFLGALVALEALITYCPDYAEGYNQRAFVQYLRQDYAAAVPDLEKALELSPNHVAARAGLALTLMNMGKTDAARQALQDAVALNPWLSERHLLAKGAPLAPKGEDI